MGFLDNLLLGDEIERGKELDAKIRALNAKKEAQGFLTSGQRQAADDNLAKESGPVWEEQINQDFSAGLDEGYANVTGAIKTGINAPAKFLAASIPWWVWVLVLGYAAFQLKVTRSWLKRIMA